MAAGAQSGAGRRARSDARLAGRGAAGRQRAAPPVHAVQQRAPARGARRPSVRIRRRVVFTACGGRIGERARAAVPETRVIDSHTHLQLCEPPDAELVAAAAEAGVKRIVTVGTDGASLPGGAGGGRGLPAGVRGDRPPPEQATGFDDADLAELEALAAHPSCVAIGETGLDYYRDYAPAADQQRAFEAQIELARAIGKPLVIHTRAADDDTLAMLPSCAGGVRVILHCFSMPDRIDDASRTTTGGSRSPATSPTRRRRAALAAAARAGGAAAGRDRRPVPGAAAHPRQAEPAGPRRRHRHGARGRAAGRVRRARGGRRGDAAAVFGW